MSAEENKALARRIIEEAWNQGNLAAAEELLAPGYVGHNSQVPNQPPSHDLYKQFIVTTRTAFPDFHATIEDQIAEGDLVMTRWSGRGTHQGIHMGIPPTHKQITMTGSLSSASWTARQWRGGWRWIYWECCKSLALSGLQDRPVSSLLRSGLSLSRSTLE